MKQVRYLPRTRAISLSASAIAIALFTCFVADRSNAQPVEAEQSDSGDFDEALDEMSIDVGNSIGDALQQRGLAFDGDSR